MSQRRGWRLFFPELVCSLSADFAVVVAGATLTLVVTFTPGLAETPLRDIASLVFSLFLPGYVLIAALFPERGPPMDAEDRDRMGGIGGTEQAVLSFGTSIVIVSLLGLVLNFTPWGIRLGPILVTLSGFMLVATAFAAIRRSALPEDERFVVLYERWSAVARDELFSPASRTDAMLNVALVASAVLATTSVDYAVAVLKDGESFTELYLLIEDGNDEFTADDYPEEPVRGRPASLVLGVGNQEHRTANYIVVTVSQRVEVSSNPTIVLKSERPRMFMPRFEYNETWHGPHEVRPMMTGERLRLTYLLYEDAPPAALTADNAYHEVHLRVAVRAE